MDEEQVKTLLGDDYKEGITAEEVSTIMQQRYSNNNSEEIEKLNKELENAKKQNSEYKKKLKANSSETEKKELEDEEKNKRIEELEKQIEEQKLESSQAKATSKIMEIKDLAGIEEKDITDLVKEISSTDVEKTNKIASSIGELIKKAHEKGKSDSVKDAMGNMGKMKDGNNNGENKKQSLGARLAAQKNAYSKANDDSLYFKRK